MVTLQNDQLRVTVRTLGAELQTVTAADGTEYLWHGDAAFWEDRAPILFPICGRVRNNEYRYEGNTYTIRSHGFTKESEFTVETQTDTEVVMVLRDNEKTRASYPFAFEFRVRYALKGDSLVVEYAIHNPAEDVVLPASMGSHEGYACPEGLSAYELVFEKEEPMESTVVGDEGMVHETYMVEAPNGVLPLKDEFFAIDALVFRDLQSKEVTLRNRTTGRGVKVAYGDVDTLLIWSIPGAPYVCIEPWQGFPDWVDFEGTFTEKEGMHFIPAGDTFRWEHIITLLP